MKETILIDLIKKQSIHVQIVATVPEKDYKPSASVWKYMELMHHGAYSVMWMQDNYVLEVKSE